MTCNWKQSGENGGTVLFVLRKAKPGLLISRSRFLYVLIVWNNILNSEF